MRTTYVLAAVLAISLAAAAQTPVQNFGVVADAVKLSGCSISAGNTILHCPNSSFSYSDTGKVVDVAGAGNAFSGNVGSLVATVRTVLDSNDIILSTAALNTATAATALYCTDNTAAVQRAVSQAQGTLYFPTGQYCIRGQISLNGSTPTTALTGNGMWNSIIYQVGPMFQHDGTISPATDMFYITGSNYTITNLGLSGTNWTGIPRHCCGSAQPILVENYGPANNGVFSNDRFDSSWGIGWQGWNVGGTASNITLSYNESAYNGADGLNPNVNYSTITNNTLFNNTQAGIESAGSHNVISYNTCYKNAASCISLGGGGAAGYNVVRVNVACNNYNGITVGSATMYDEIGFNSACSNDAMGVVVESGGYTYVHDNTITDNGCTVLAQCNIQAPQTPRLTSNLGIYNTTANNIIVNNTMGNTGVPGFTQKFGLDQESTANMTTIEGNHSIGHNLGDYYFKASTNNYYLDPLFGVDRVSFGTATFLPGSN